ncbi:MAG TPA: M23 family metallopeptidase, partial [Trueperaceae bacterium]|nr:M23 family metallopeptidase [Trueperaceae bacterium]
IEDGDTEYFYAHASEILVTEGQRVDTGAILAHIGSTGNSTGSHLHFEIRVAGDPVDPLPILESTAEN